MAKKVVRYRLERHKWADEVEKAKKLKACDAKKSEYGDSAKYVTFVSTNKKGEKTDEKIKVEKSNIIAPRVPLNSHNDHRIVMALSVLCSLTGGIIEGAEAVNKSFPNFFEKIAKLGIKVEENVIKG